MLGYFQLVIIMLVSLLICFGEKYAHGEVGHEQQEIGMEKSKNDL